MSEDSGPLYLRTHHCGQLQAGDVGSKVRLAGWVDSYRDHGGVIFVDLRDREGLTQLVFNPQTHSDSHKAAESLRSEHVIAVEGVVDHRPEGTVNQGLSTGEIEVEVHQIEILSRPESLPFELSEGAEVSEDLRLRYRFFDLRRPKMQKNLHVRHRICQIMRSFLDERGFWEIETPFLTKSTPEGARDFLVPARLSPGEFFALPQSPQLFKQILMMAGYDKYFQIVRCFRDEDLRADRQPEFTQLDLEMAFVAEEQVIEVIEGLMQKLSQEILKIEVPEKFPRLSYAEAMDRFGCDRPDLRFGMEIKDIKAIAENCQFKVYQEAIKSGGQVRGICVPGGAGLSRKELDELTTFAKGFGAKGLAWFRGDPDKLYSPLTKFFSQEQLATLTNTFETKCGDLILTIADKPDIVAKTLAALRNSMAERFKLIPQSSYEFCWVLDFPLFEADTETQKPTPMHHPFTSPRLEDIDKLQSSPLETRARAYDIILNGTELGGGSIRIHQQQLQQQVFSLLGIGADEAQSRFGFLLDALRLGAPPHGGIALGLDRMAMLFTGTDSIREVIAFPKTQRGNCLMTEAPSGVDEKQLAELGLRIAAPAKKKPPQ
ncbi:MAG: aspartate--tRNA ligase [Actinobacteria bacterium]|nr:aspartate--tRNA ligase [Actinomycetota bacterium]